MCILRNLSTFTFMDGYTTIVDSFSSIIDGPLHLKLLNKEFVFDSRNLDSGLKIKIQVDSDILIIVVNKDRLYSGRAFVFILWMIFSSIILFLIAYIFMKNQTRPLKKLSILAETQIPAPIPMT